MASVLPFDILIEIFEQYFLEETPEHPVETLLLVCKSWCRAALGAPYLWSNFTILDDFDFWASCVPRRLARCRDGTLLNIHIWVGKPPCFEEDETTVDHDTLYLDYHSILGSLTGPHGEFARRWRKFRVVDYFQGRGEWTSRLAEYLVFPTPYLQELHLYSLSSPLRVFPHTPVLKTLQAWDIKFSSFPDLTATTSVRILYCLSFAQELASATQLVDLSIDFYALETLSTTFPQLRSLTVCGVPLSGEMNGFSAPLLQSLILQVRTPTAMSVLLSCKGLPFNQITRLGVEFEDPFGDPTLYAEYLPRFLCTTKSLRVLQLDGIHAIALVLKLFTSECQSLYQDRDLRLEIDDEEYTLGRGDKRVLSVKEVLETMPSIPSGPWEDIFEILRHVR